MDTNLRRQENNLSLTNTFTKGMNTDVAYDFVSNDLYLFGKNIRIVNNAILCEEPDSNNVNGVVAPVPAGKGVKFVFKDVREDPEQDQSTEDLWTSDDVDRILAVKTVDNIGAIILKYKGTNEEPTKGLWRVFKAEKIQEKNDQDVLEDKIALTYIYVSTETTDRDRFSISVNKETTDLIKLYIADGKHGIIIINLTEEDLSYYKGLTEDELSPNRMYPSKAPVFVAKITGTLLTSLVLYAYRLYKKHGVCSKMSPLTHKIQVISNSRQTDVGNEEDTLSSIGFRLRIDIAHRHAQLYDKLQLYRVSYIKYGEEPKCELIWDAKFDKSGMGDNDDPVLFNISDNGIDALEEYTVDEFNQLSGLSIIPQLIDYNQLYMFAADIADETIIKIPDVKLNTQAYSANNNFEIKLYRDASYGNHEGIDYELNSDIALADRSRKTFYINRYTDMSLVDYYLLNSDDVCRYVPREVNNDYVLGGAGPVVEWRFVVRKSPIHENIYDKHFSTSSYSLAPSSETIGTLPNSIAGRSIAGSLLWGYSDEINDYEQYTKDVPKTVSTDNINYFFLKLDDESNTIIECSTERSDLDDLHYLTDCGIDSDRSNSFDDVFTSSVFRSLQRGEVYRYGIVFYDNNGNKTDVNWIADIRVPSVYEYPIVEYDSVNGILYANNIGIWFNVTLPNAVITDYNLLKYEIVRCKKTPQFSKSLLQVATSRPLSLKLFLNEKGAENTYYPYYSSALLTTDPYQIGFRLNRGQGRDYASASEINNYHRGIDVTQHQLDFLQLFSPEIQCRREDTLDILLASNILLHTLCFTHCGFTLNDYDVIFRCKNQYAPKKVTNAEFKWYWPISNKVYVGENDVKNRCLEYGQCLHGFAGIDYAKEGEEEHTRIIPNITPSIENVITSRLATSTIVETIMYMHPYSLLTLPSSSTQVNFNIPTEWNSGDSSGLYNFVRNYIYSSESSLDRSKKDVLFIDAFNKVRRFYDDLNIGHLLLSGTYLTIHPLNGYRLRMYTPFPILNRAYIENDKDRKNLQCYVFKNYNIDKQQLFPIPHNKYTVLARKQIDIKAISDVQNPLWEDGYDDVELSTSIVDTAVKKYKTYLTSVGSKTYCNWSACGLYNWRAGQNDTVPRITEGYVTQNAAEPSSEPGDLYSRILHFYSPAAEAAKEWEYNPGGVYWGDETGTGVNNGAPYDYWTYPSKDLRWNNAWFGPGPVCFLVELADNLGQMNFEYGLFMASGMLFPIPLNETISLYYYDHSSVGALGGGRYSHAPFTSFGTWICNITHTAKNFAGMTTQEKFYDSYLSFSNIVDLIKKTQAEDSPYIGAQCVFDGDTYILPCEFTSCFKTYNNNAASSTLNSQLFVYYIPMETKINVCFDYGKNYRNTVNPNLQLEEGDMEGVASQDRPLHQYNYIYSDNNNSIREYMASMDEDEITHIEHRIVYSEPKTNGEDIDSWNTFKAANFIDADSHYGKITYLFTVKDIIHFWLTRAFGRLTVNERSLVTDENQNLITLGTGGVVQRTDYISTNYGMKQYDMSAVNAESDVYWIDRTNNILAVYSQGRVGSIGELHNVQNLINHLIDQDNLPTIHYDINAKEVIAKFLHQIDNNVETIEQLIYNTRVNIATAVYTRGYDDILEFNNVLYGINIKKLEATLYNFLSKDDVKESYLHPARLSFLVNVAPDTTKVFDNQKIVTTRRKSYNHSDEQEYTKNYMLNKKYTFTTDIHDTEWNQFNEASEAITDREGNILYTIPRYGDNVKWGSRLNGKWMKVDLDMMLDYQITGQTNQTETKYRLEDDKPISQIITKFRRSYV